MDGDGRDEPGILNRPTMPAAHLPASARRRRAALRAMAAAALAPLAALWAAHARADTLAIGQPAPPLTLHTLDGRELSTTALRGKVLILAFWATWCDPCREELPLLSAFAARHAAQGLQVLGFCLDDPSRLTEVRAVARTLSFPVGLLGSAYAGGYGRIWRLPVSFVVDRCGRLADNGWDDAHPAWTEARLRRVVAPLLAQPGCAASAALGAAR